MFYKIADCVVEYDPLYEMMRRKMVPYQCEKQKRDIAITISEEFCMNKQKENPHLSLEQCEYIFAGIQFYGKLLRYGGFVLHASAVVVDGEAYLFSADSGTGKSTHTKLWQSYFGEDKAVIINDDKPAIRIEKGGCMVYGTPFSGKTDENRNQKAVLRGICMLERGEENQIRAISPKEALPLLMRQTLLPVHEDVVDELFSMLDAVLKKVPIYRMECNISEEAAVMAYKTMGRKDEGKTCG
ncbi:hypothetical protein [Lachnoclostridium sp. An181]|uniref:hypothetical protein n=1 Tax=Lachnoclostridium sp. An181 TaxID=1965575 RepID=UPI000B374ABA|nr:hypothetical protein [Lachnoclostridium sp. An181]OUP49446.1 hypothetical protein B5F18_07575 [Lachnoclostridium sp. An181]